MVSPPHPFKSMRDFFLEKLCTGDRPFWQIFGGMSYMGTNDQIMQGGNSFTKAFSSNLTTANLKFFPAMVGDSLENKSLPVYRSMKGFILEVIC